MSYMGERMKFLNAIEVYEYYKMRYGAPGEKREEKKRPTPEQMEKINQQNRERLARWKLREHFDVNDYFIRLSYTKEKRPVSMEAAKGDFKRFIRKLRGEYQKRGYELKWMRNIEVGTRGAWHVHVIMNRIPEADILVRKAWEQGSVWFQLLYEKGEFSELAKYITKTPKTDKRLKESSYSASRNLPLREPEKKEYTHWKKWGKVRIPRGWYLEPDSLTEGENPVTGHCYRRYTLLRIERKERPPAKPSKPRASGKKARGKVKGGKKI